MAFRVDIPVRAKSISVETEVDFQQAAHLPTRLSDLDRVYCITLVINLS